MEIIRQYDVQLQSVLQKKNMIVSDAYLINKDMPSFWEASGVLAMKNI
jgi:hypothetical protein